jgi:hypothetical protein
VLPSVDVAAGDEFGAAIGVHGSLVAIGLPGADHLGVSDCGSVRLFRWNGTSLEEEARLHPPVPTANERFGMAVAVYGSTVAVGVPLASVGGELEAGKVFIFRHLGGGSWAADVEFTRPGAAAGDRFGTSVTLRGGFLAVGAPQADPAGAADAGEVCVFRVDGGTTVPTVTLSGMPPAAGDRAGQGVALGGDPHGPSLLIGVPGDDDNGAADSGAVYLHGLDTGGGATLRARLVGAPVSGRGLGSAVAMSGNGQTLAASAPLADVAAGVDAGLALAWRFNGSGWLMSSLSPPSHAAGERFGSSLAMDENGGVLVVGSPASVGSGIAQRGRATSFQRRGEASWDGGARLEDGLGGPSASRFGAAVGVIDTKPLVGGPFHTPPAGGAVLRFGFVRDCLGNDSDADGMGDACDGCPGDHSKIWGEQCGCGNLETDGDSDGTSDCRDDCPGDPGKTGPGACGCGIADMDSDSDGIADCLDADDDNDGIDDTSDGCPFDAAKSSPGLCGCGTPDADGDGDGTPDCLDGCEADAAKTAPGLCGCGVADVDSDGDELVDCLGGGVLAENATPAGPALASGDDYGWSVSTDGDIAVVGMPGEDLAGGKTDAGAAVVLVRTAGVWSVQATLTATDSRKQDRFGGAVALSGDLIVVGAPLADVSGIKDAGAAYVFRRAGSGWSQEVKFTRPLAAASDRFGDAVAVRGDFVAVGAPQANAGGLNDSGVVSVFEFESLVWSPRSNLTGVPVTAGDRFGQSVAFGGSAATPVLAVGATGDDQGSQTNCGAVYVMALDADGVAVATVRLLEVTPQKNAGLGASVSVDDAGTTVAAGAPLANVTGAGLKSGEVTVWTESGTWSATTVVPPDHSSNDQFGTSVALNNAGDALVVGSPFDTVVGVAGRGSATVFSLSSGSWRIYDRLTLPAVGATASQFGRSAAFAGGTILIGGPKHDGRGTLREFAGVP